MSFDQPFSSSGSTLGAPRYPVSWWIMDRLNAGVERLPALVTRAVPLLMLLPAMLLVGLLLVGLVMVADQSFHATDPETTLPKKAYTIANYLTLLHRAHYQELAIRSAWAGVVVAAVSVVLGFPYAYFMVRVPSKAVRKALLCCIFLPHLLGSVVRGFAWLVVLGRDGLINGFLGLVGVPPLPLMYNMTGVLIGLTQVCLPLAVLMIAPAVTAVGEEIDEAAQVLGAHWLRALWTVTLPLVRAGLVRAFVIILILVFSDMAIPYILGGGRTDFIATAIFSSFMETGDPGIGAALCVVTTLLSTGLIVLLFLLRSVLSAGRMTANSGHA